MAEFYLVRHGQASFGTDDYDRLSALGRQQSLWLGQYFAERGITFDQIIIGDQLRHLQTAEEICRGMGCSLSFTKYPELNEYDFHALYTEASKDNAELRNLAAGDQRDFYKGLKQVLKLWSTGRLTGPIPESWQAFTQRISHARHLIQRSGAQSLLVVSSGGAIGMMAQQVLGAPAETAIELNLQIKNASFSHYYFNEHTVRLASFNSTPHLDQLDRLHAMSHG